MLKLFIPFILCFNMYASNYRVNGDSLLFSVNLFSLSCSNGRVTAFDINSKAAVNVSVDRHYIVSNWLYNERLWQCRGGMIPDCRSVLITRKGTIYSVFDESCNLSSYYYYGDKITMKEIIEVKEKTIEEEREYLLNRRWNSIM